MKMLRCILLPIVLWFWSLPSIVLAHDEEIAPAFEDIRTNCKLAPDKFILHWPYDVEADQRFSYNSATEVLHFTVRKDDKPFREKEKVPTKPRCEARFTEVFYTTGIWIFEGRVVIPKNVTGACVAQARCHTRHTLTMIDVQDGNLLHYDNKSEILAENIYDNEQHIMIRHDVGLGTVEHFMNKTLKLTSKIDLQVQKAAGPFYFKVGVYMQENPSPVMEASWSDINIWDCTDVTPALVQHKDSKEEEEDDAGDDEEDDEDDTHDDDVKTGDPNTTTLGIAGNTLGSTGKHEHDEHEEHEHQHKKHKKHEEGEEGEGKTTAKKT